MCTKNNSNFPMIITRATLTVGAPSATFWTIATTKVINIFGSFVRQKLIYSIKNIFSVGSFLKLQRCKTSPPGENFVSRILHEAICY